MASMSYGCRFVQLQHKLLRLVADCVQSSPCFAAELIFNKTGLIISQTGLRRIRLDIGGLVIEAAVEHADQHSCKDTFPDHMRVAAWQAQI
jgi:hypothetical protein